MSEDDRGWVGSQMNLSMVVFAAKRPYLVLSIETLSVPRMNLLTHYIPFCLPPTPQRKALWYKSYNSKRIPPL